MLFRSARRSRRCNSPTIARRAASPSPMTPRRIPRRSAWSCGRDDSQSISHVVPTRRHDRKFRRRHLVITTLFVLLLVIYLALAWDTPHCWPVFGVIGIVGLVIRELRFRRYRCPDCGTRLPYFNSGPGSRIEYVCLRCDVVWDSEIGRAHV